MSTVARPERTRLLEALLEELVEKGYPALEVDAAIERAGLTGRGWSGRLPDKDACLIEAFEESARRLRAEIGRGCREGRTWPERVAAGLRALLAELAERAVEAEALTRAFPSIGPDAMLQYQSFLEVAASSLSMGRELAAAELPAEVEILAAGAAEAIILEEIHAGATASLPTLGPEILFSLLVPFIGPRAAGREMTIERARIGGERPAAAP